MFLLFGGGGGQKLHPNHEVVSGPEQEYDSCYHNLSRWQYVAVDIYE